MMFDKDNSELSERQSNFLMGLAMGVNQLVSQLKYDCDKTSERKEILQVLELFYSSMYQGHIKIMEDERNGITPETNSDKEL